MAAWLAVQQSALNTIAAAGMPMPYYREATSKWRKQPSPRYVHYRGVNSLIYILEAWRTTIVTTNCGDIGSARLATRNDTCRWPVTVVMKRHAMAWLARRTGVEMPQPSAWYYSIGKCIARLAAGVS